MVIPAKATLRKKSNSKVVTAEADRTPKVVMAKASEDVSRLTQALLVLAFNSDSNRSPTSRFDVDGVESENGRWRAANTSRDHRDELTLIAKK